MRKKVLAIYYTQSGQLEEIVNNFTSPFESSGVMVEKVRVWPNDDFEFPWTSERFFDAMPESVKEVPVPLQPFSLQEEAYDLIIFAYQPWFLSPSIPATSILVHPTFLQVVRNTPVITLIGSRNMWLSAQEKIKIALQKAGANLVGNVALIDRNNNLVSAVTILYWMLTGKKDQYLGIFPKPGVSNEDIASVTSYGAIAKDSLLKEDWEGLQHELIAAKAVEVKPDLMFIESRGARLFSIWGNLISKRKNRSPWLTLFKYYLLVALFIVAPIVVTINNLLFRHFFKKQIKRKQNYYLGLRTK